MEKIGPVMEKILDQKIGEKNFSWKMDEKIGLDGEKIRGQKIGVKNAGWKIDAKNWTRR